MASTKIQALKIIWENKGKAPLLKIAKELKISTDYSHLICKELLKNKIVELLEGQYKITDLGREELKKLGVIKEKAKPLKKTTTRPPRPSTKGRPLVRIKRKKEKKKVLEGRKATITKLSDLSPKLIETLKKKGFRTLEDIATTSVSRLRETTEGLELKKAAEMINEARDKLRKEGKEYLWE